jgi:cytochrome oxidase Cu insertion factor (SCO1/SenC/PrrC family)
VSGSVNPRTKILAAVAIVFFFGVALCAAAGETLPKIKPAPQFTLTNQDAKRLSLKELRQGACHHVHLCELRGQLPDAAAKMTFIQDRLGPAFGPQVFFLSITVDPERDTPVVLSPMPRRTELTRRVGHF